MNVSSDLQKTKESVQTFSVNKRRFDLIFWMQYSLKCFMETRRVSHSFSCSTTLTESSHRWAEPSALHVLCDHMWRELERVRGEEVSGSRGMFRAIRQEVQPLEKARGGGRARWWRRVMDRQAEHAGRTDHTVMLSSHFSCCLLQSRLKRRPWLGKIHFHTFTLMFQPHVFFFSWKRKRGEWFNILGLKSWVSSRGVFLSHTDGSNSPQLQRWILQLLLTSCLESDVFLMLSASVKFT